MQQQLVSLIADRPSFAGRPSRLSLVGTDGSYPSLFDVLVMQAVQLRLTDATTISTRTQIALVNDPKTKEAYPIFATESVFAGGPWRMICTERSLNGKLGMTFVLLEQREKTIVHLLRATSPGISETGVDLKRWVFGRTRYSSDSNFMKQVCKQIHEPWLLDLNARAYLCLSERDLRCQHSDFALTLFSVIVETMALAPN